MTRVTNIICDKDENVVISQDPTIVQKQITIFSVALSLYALSPHINLVCYCV